MNRREFLALIPMGIGTAIVAKAKPGRFHVTEVDHEARTVTVDSQPECPDGLAWHTTPGNPYEGMYRARWEAREKGAK